MSRKRADLIDVSSDLTEGPTHTIRSFVSVTIMKEEST